MGLFKKRSLLGAGARIPDFELEDLGGTRQSLSSLTSDSPLVLAFFKTSCPTCQFTFPFLERLHRGGVKVYAVSQDDAGSTREFLEEFGISFPALLDKSGKGYVASNGFGISTVPTTFLIEKDGTVALSFEGFGKSDLESLGRHLGVQVFRPGEYVPEWKAG